MVWVTMTIMMRSRNKRINASTFSVEIESSAAHGSSINSTLGSTATARDAESLLPSRIP